LASLELGGSEPQEIAQKQRFCRANWHLWRSEAASHGKSSRNDDFAKQSGSSGARRRGAAGNPKRREPKERRTQSGRLRSREQADARAHERESESNRGDSVGRQTKAAIRAPPDRLEPEQRHRTARATSTQATNAKRPAPRNVAPGGKRRLPPARRLIPTSGAAERAPGTGYGPGVTGQHHGTAHEQRRDHGQRNLHACTQRAGAL